MLVKELIEKNEKIYQKTKKIKELSNNIEQNICPEELTNAELYYKLTSSLSAQMKAPMGEKFLCKKLNFTQISASQNCGDAVDSNGLHYEFKNSFTNSGNNLNIRQIRLWQNIDYYYCIFINEEELNKSLFFILSKEDMEKEVQLCGGASHGTSIANKNNENIEYSISIPVYNDSNTKTKRWKQNYLSSSLKTKIFGECI